MKTLSLNSCLQCLMEHNGTRKPMQTKFDGVDHQFDMWHLCKSICKKLIAVSKRKICKDITYWITPINHLWWSAQRIFAKLKFVIQENLKIFKARFWSSAQSVCPSEWPPWLLEPCHTTDMYLDNKQLWKKRASTSLGEKRFKKVHPKQKKDWVAKAILESFVDDKWWANLRRANSPSWKFCLTPSEFVFREFFTSFATHSPISMDDHLFEINVWFNQHSYREIIGLLYMRRR